MVKGSEITYTFTDIIINFEVLFSICKGTNNNWENHYEKQFICLNHSVFLFLRRLLLGGEDGEGQRGGTAVGGSVGYHPGAV